MIKTSDFRGRTVALIGAGVSNVPLIGFLKELGAVVTLREKKSEEELGDRAREIKEKGARLITGEGYLEELSEDVIIRSPGIRPDIPEFAAAAARGALITCEMELFAGNAPCPVYAVTGSDGKSTTTTILSMLLSPEGKSYLGGNIGEPLFHKVTGMTEKDAAAVELSSFQLMTMDAPFASSVITNVTPNHLNWHTGMDEYEAAKCNILRHTGRAVLNFDDERCRAIGEKLISEGKNVAWFSLSPLEPVGVALAAWFDGEKVYIYEAGETRVLMDRSEIVLPGRHNVANYMAASLAAWGLTSEEKIRKVASTFGGVKHRLQLIAEADGVRYYNSSIDSSPTRTAAAISALYDTAPERRVHIICGGYDKKIPFAPLADALYTSRNVATVTLTGATAGLILDALEKSDMKNDSLKIATVPDFDGAVKYAAGNARHGDSVLLSPACASFDAFPNFEVRGERFVQVVKEIIGG
ncbi:MAG: UDP-N-acetylmuramoyl-L-alanine--D-glutamate ligase [Clostridia bacterium]|nr:UDP-N-acetylmuramoyl-L-alanine--D-glutamate ligase [Clostridia bacterium]